MNLKRKLLRKCPTICVRTDLQTMGLFVMKHWLLKFILDFEAENKGVEFTHFGTEFVNFLIKNQFKKAISKFAPESKDMAVGDNSSIAAIMNPMQTLFKKDFVKIQMHILPREPDFKVS